MKKFLDLESIPAVINEINIDTDDIIPKRFLKTIHRTGLGKYLFYNRRFDKNSNKKAEFILNNKPWNNSKILLAGSKKNPVLLEGDIINVNLSVFGKTTSIISDVATPALTSYSLYSIFANE